jgi:hypothetical protein
MDRNNDLPLQKADDILNPGDQASKVELSDHRHSLQIVDPNHALLVSSL